MLDPTQYPAFLIVLVGAIGLSLMARGAYQMWQGDGAIDWPTVEGVVQTSMVKSRTRASVNVGPIPIYQRSGGYEVVVRYAYKIADRVHESDRWSFTGGLVFPDEASAEEKARQYREATPITVRYDPADPERSVIKPGDSDGALFRSLWGAGIFLVALYAYMAR